MKTKVSILGATGLVGQFIIRLIENTPEFKEQFEIAELFASDKNIGKRYEDACLWHEGEIPDYLRDMKIMPYKELNSPYTLSALPSDIAGKIENYLTEKGIHVVSNAGVNRMRPEVPLIIPEINSDHIDLVNNQSTSGKIITNPNCATVFLAMALYPLQSLGVIEYVSVVTAQAISGAGFPGVSSLSILSDIIPNIGGEEEKIESESLKILGELSSPAKFKINAQVTRVPVVHGHTLMLNVSFKDKIVKEDVVNKFLEFEKELPLAYKYYDDDFSPRPRAHLSQYDMKVHLGRVKQAGDNKISFVALGHNLVRGAAGAALTNLSLLAKYLKN